MDILLVLRLQQILFRSDSDPLFWVKDYQFYVRANDVASDIHSVHTDDSWDITFQGVLLLSINNIAEIVYQNSNAHAHFSVGISCTAKCNDLLHINYIVFVSVSSA